MALQNKDRSGSVSSLFRACDLDGSGYIDEAELANICPELTTAEVRSVFQVSIVKSLLS
jgi:Ca2+-binding EF-hand superfamily protein